MDIKESGLDKIGEELKRQGFQVSTPTISKILREELDFSLQAQRKTKEGAKQHPDRDAQFQYLNQQCQDFQQRGQPVISVDANYARSGIMHGFRSPMSGEEVARCRERRDWKRMVRRSGYLLAVHNQSPLRNSSKRSVGWKRRFLTEGA